MYHLISIYPRKDSCSPPDWNKSYNNNYGLCNQLLVLIGYIIISIVKKGKNEPRGIVVDSYSCGVDTGKIDKIKNILDLEYINKELTEYKIRVEDRSEIYFPPEIWDKHCKMLFNWYIYFEPKLFLEILQKIKFTKVFHDIADEIIRDNIDVCNNNCDFMHLRIEEDAIDSWADKNKMEPEKFKELVLNKYRDSLKILEQNRKQSK